MCWYVRVRTTAAVSNLQRSSVSVSPRSHPLCTGLPFNLLQQLTGKATSLEDHKRLLMALTSGKFERVDQFLRAGISRHLGVLGMLTLYDAAARGYYKPKGYTEEDEFPGILLWRLGGNRNWSPFIGPARNDHSSKSF